MGFSKAGTASTAVKVPEYRAEDEECMGKKLQKASKNTDAEANMILEMNYFKDYRPTIDVEAEEVPEDEDTPAG